MSKKIKFEIVDIVRNEVHVRITEQTHRGEDFGDNSKIFTAGNGFDLISDGYPAVDPFDKGYEFYLQGEKQDRDDEILVFTTEQFMAYVKAVTEYNKYYKDWSDEKDEKDVKDEKEPPTRPLGEVFDYTTPNGEVVKLEVCENKKDSRGYYPNCTKCYFLKNPHECTGDDVFVGFCCDDDRIDKTSVFFKKVEDAPKFKIGDWVYFTHTKEYLQIVNSAEIKRLEKIPHAPARKRLKDIFEAYGLMGKSYISGVDTFCLITSIKCRDGLYINGIHSRHFEEGGEYKLINDLSVYEFEHLNDDGEWVK